MQAPKNKIWCDLIVNNPSRGVITDEAIDWAVINSQYVIRQKITKADPRIYLVYY